MRHPYPLDRSARENRERVGDAAGILLVLLVIAWVLISLPGCVVADRPAVLSVHWSGCSCEPPAPPAPSAPSGAAAPPPKEVRQ